MKNKKAMTERAIAARRLSAQLSTGPKTTLGKKRSSLNALKEGLYSKELTISEADRTEFDALRKRIFRQLAPATALQTLGVDSIVACAWRCKLATRLEMRKVESFSAVPQEPSSENAGAERDAGATQWYGAGREALRAGMRLLADLRTDISQNGALHLADRKGQIVKAFGVDFYDDVASWEPMNVQAILLAESLAAHEANFNLGPIPELQPAQGVKIVEDPKQKLTMMLKLVDLKMQQLVDLWRATASTQTRETMLTDFVPRHFPTVSRDYQRAVAWYIYLKDNKL